MKPKIYATATAFRRALEDRLAAISKAERVDLQRIRRQVAFDRLLCRLFAEENPPWSLKGGYALELKLTAARATKDIDLGLIQLSVGQGDWKKRAMALLMALQEMACIDLGDFSTFVIGEPTQELEAAPESGARYPIEALLDGRTFAKFQLDVAAGDVQREPVELVQARSWLEFAGFAAPVFRTIASEEHFAQKLHAYTYPRTGRLNTRVKDLVDLILLIERGGMDHARLARDLIDTFAHRGTHPLPQALEPPPDFWRSPFAALAIECGIEPDIELQFGRVRAYCASLLG